MRLPIGTCEKIVSSCANRLVTSGGFLLRVARQAAGAWGIRQVALTAIVFRIG